MFPRFSVRSLSEMSSGHLYDLAELETMARTTGLTIVGYFDAVALSAAIAYRDRELPFEIADRLVNKFRGTAAIHGIEVSSLFLDAYEAFDEGEYMHSDDPRGTDAEAKYTRPRIASLLLRVVANDS